MKLRSFTVFSEVLTNEAATPPVLFKIFSYGSTDSTKGPYVFDKESADSVMSNYVAHGVDLSIDYEHQSIAHPPIKAPAAAWFTPVLQEDGLYASNVKWTQEASAFLTSKEYRYFSPAFEQDEKTGRVMRLLNLALTNLPATRNIPALVAASAKGQITMSEEQKESGMRPVIVALGLRESAKDSEALTAIVQLADAKREILALSERTNVSEAIGVIAGWKSAATQVTALNHKVAELEKSVRDREVAELVEQGKREGRVPPTLVAWALSLGSRDMVALREFVTSAPVLVAAAPVAQSEPGKGGQVVSVTRDFKTIAKALNLKAADVIVHAQKRITDSDEDDESLPVLSEKGSS